jgi:hypothetical protein
MENNAASKIQRWFRALRRTPRLRKDASTQVELTEFEARLREFFQQINEPDSLQGQLQACLIQTQAIVQMIKQK